MIVGAWSTLQISGSILSTGSQPRPGQILLRDEIDHRQYLFIQKQRYGEKLNYESIEKMNGCVINSQISAHL